MAEQITPPDMIGAGVASPQQPSMDASSLMSALRQPALPPDMAGLMATPRQSPGQAYAQAAAGGVSAMTGQPNPVMQQMQFQQQQAAQYAHMAERVQHRRDREAEGLLNISKDLLNSESEDARMVGARGLLNHAKTKGMDVGSFEPLVKSLATRRADGKEMTEILREMGMGLDDATIVTRHPNAKPEMLAMLRANSKNDDARRLAGLPTQREERMAILQEKEAEAKLIEAQFPELKGQPELTMLVEMTHRKLNAQKGYREGTKETQRVAFEMAYEQFKRQKDTELAIKGQEAARKAVKDQMEIDLIRQVTSGLGGGTGTGPLGGGVSGFDMEIKAGPLTLKPKTKTVGELADLQRVGAVLDTLDGLTKSLITAKSAPEAMLIQAPKLHWGAQTGNNVIAATYLKQKAAFLAPISKTLMGETGVLTDRDIERVADAFPTFGDTVKIRDLKMAFFRNLYETTKELKQAVLEGRPVDPTAYQQRILQSLGKIEGPAKPTRPISPDGKYEWDGKAWIAR